MLDIGAGNIVFLALHSINLSKEASQAKPYQSMSMQTVHTPNFETVFNISF